MTPHANLPRLAFGVAARGFRAVLDAKREVRGYGGH